MFQGARSGLWGWDARTPTPQTVRKDRCPKGWNDIGRLNVSAACMVIYATNVIEPVNMSLRKLTKNRGSFPSDEALTKLFSLALRNIIQKWTMPTRE